MSLRSALIVLGLIAGALLALVVINSSTARQRALREYEPSQIHPGRYIRFDRRAGRMSSSHVLFDQESEPRGALSLRGRVVGVDGRGVGAAEVLLDSVPARVTTTDENGHFSFEELIPRSYVVRSVSGDAWGMAAVRLTRGMQVVAVHLQRGVTVAARVVDSRSEKPIAGARVSIGDISATTSSQGQAILRPVRPGWADIESSAAGYASVRTSSIVSTAALDRVEIRMGAGRSIGGLVVDEHGAPVPLASIFVVDDALVPAAGTKPAALTDENGRFHVAEVRVGVRRILAVDARHAPATSRPLVVEADHLDVVITMSRGRRFDGRVVDSAGVPVVAAIVRVDSADQSYSRQTMSGADGRFTVRGLGETFFRVRAEAASGASETKVVDLVVSDVESVELKLLPTGVISGNVEDEEGRPCADAVVNAMLTVNDSVYASVVADHEGRFTVDDLPEGQYVVWSGRFSELLSQREEIVVSTGDTNVLVKKSAFGSLRGKIAIENGTHPPDDALVMIAGTTVGIEQSYRVLDTGVFEFVELPSDDYRMTIRGPEFVETTLDVKVAAGSITELGRVRVFRGRAISGRVVDEKASPISAARLHIGPEHSGVDYDNLVEPWERTTGADGRFSITGLRDSERYLLVATHYQGCSRGVVASPMDTDAGPLTMILLPCGSVVGTVNEAGRPRRNLLITIGDPPAEAASTDENGGFAFARVPKGVAPIQVFAPGSPAPVFEGVIEVQAGKQSDLALDVQRSAP